MSACKVPWCVALARLDGVFCAVHGDRGEKFQTGPSGRLDSKGDCIWCDGSGECTQCDEDGECTCECGDEHECHQCDGSHECDACSGTGWKNGPDVGLKKAEKLYVEWASWIFEPHVACVTYPWDSPEGSL